MTDSKNYDNINSNLETPPPKKMTSFLYNSL